MFRSGVSWPLSPGLAQGELHGFPTLDDHRVNHRQIKIAGINGQRQFRAAKDHAVDTLVLLDHASEHMPVSRPELPLG
jgi:hypothetical protein